MDLKKFALEGNPVCRKEAVIVGDHFRITMLTTALIRFEYSEDGGFEDRATQMVCNRDFPVPEFRVSDGGEELHIYTKDLEIHYDRQKFSPSGLMIRVAGGKASERVWHYGDEPKDLLGTARTLDEADGVNYYGYNGESTNVKTGLQYLRARYYNAENGTFTTEDSDLGTTENPLTRNRYDYTTNNPLNYSDPTGHSLWSRIKSTAKKAAKAVKSVGKKIVNTAKKVVKTVVNTAKKAAKTIVNTVKGVAKTAKNAAKHAKQTYQSVKNRVTSSSTYQKITSRGSQFIRSVSNGVQKIGKTYTSFKSYVSERTAEIRSEVVRHMCTTTNRITDKLGKVDWNAVKKVAIGITAVTVSGLVVAATGGLAAGAVLAALPAMGGLGTAMVSGAVIGAIGGASYSAVNSGLSGNSLKQVAKDTLVGGIAGAVTGGVMGGLSYGAGKLLNVVRSAGSTHNDGIDKSFKKLVAEVTETKLPEGTWEKPPLERGDIIDKAMGNNLGHNFPTIDKVENGVVTSVKSRDLGAKTYQNGNKLEKVIVKDINKVSGFIGETFNGKFVNAEEIVGRQLQVVVPNVTLSEAQINAVNNATKHGIDKGVKLIITVGK